MPRKSFIVREAWLTLSVLFSFAVLLGVVASIIKQLALKFLQNDLTSKELVLIPFFCLSTDNFSHFDNLNEQFKQSISSVQSVVHSKNSSTSGNSGSFSSSSSGKNGSAC